MKKIFVYSAVGYSLYHLLSKGKQVVQAYKNIETKVVGVRNVKAGISAFTMDIDVLVSNTGGVPIDVNTGGLVTLTKVNLFSAKGTLIGTSTPGATNLNIPANGSQLIKNIPTSINSAYVLEALTDINNVKNVTTTIEIQVAGQTVTI